MGPGSSAEMIQQQEVTDIPETIVTTDITNFCGDDDGTDDSDFVLGQEINLGTSTSVM